MATSMVSPLTSPLNHEAICPKFVLPKSPFMSGSKLFSSNIPCSTVPLRTRRFHCFASAKDMSFDHIPKQFRGDNLKDKDGVMQNFNNVPKYLYGLNPTQMDMFMTEDSLINRQAAKVTEESISSMSNYMNNGGMWSMSGMTVADSRRYSMSAQMYRGGGRRGGRRSPPPDLPSLLLDSRICFLGMPIVPAVTELIIAQLMFLDWDSQEKPIYLYINSPGTQNEQREIVGSETDAFAIADALSFCKADIYTINCGMAFGQAAMLLSLGKKGKRAVQPNASTKLYLPKIYKSSGAAMDMWIKAKELDANTDCYLEFLAKGIGKSKEQLTEDISRPKFLLGKQAVDYGVADMVMETLSTSYSKRDKDAQSRATGRPGGGSQASPAGLI